MQTRVLPTCRPASIFVLLSLAFRSIVIFANPPLRGPDEIAHFLRIYSYARGELLPVTEINARKGIFVSPELYNQLYFFNTAGEVFAQIQRRGNALRPDHGRVLETRGYPWARNGTSVYVRPVRRYRGLQPGCLHSLYRRSINCASAQSRFSLHAAADAVLRLFSFHGGHRLCHRDHSSAEMGVHADRNAAGIAL